MLDTKLKPDFSGYATKAGLKCSDGRTITPDAFKHQDTMQVPLVWHHQGSDGPQNILGYAVLEHRDITHPDGAGIYAYGFFNDTEAGQTSRDLVKHGDINALSIFANKLVEKAKTVLHGAIKEVSLVMSGANPGALIDNVSIAHSDGEVEYVDDEAVIYTGLALEHTNPTDEDPEEKPSEDEVDKEEVTDETVQHAAGEETAQDVYDTLSDKQKEVVHAMIGAALEDANNKQSDSSAQHSDDDNDGAGDAVEHSDTDEGDLTHKEGSTDMGTKHNVFDQDDTGVDTSKRLSHDDFKKIIDEAKKPGGSFKSAVLQHAEEYGVTNIDLLFPDARALTQTPEWISRRMEWVAAVLDGTKHSPFAKVKSLNADITEPEARAKGYIKGTRKKDEVFALLRRTTGPATIYKKQKLDRDDILDITDIDVVNWLKAEMRLMIEEEIARAILVGDGRSTMNEDKVKDPAGSTDGTGIRSILHDDDLYSIKYPLAANVSPKDAVKGLVRARSKYRGSGKPTLFISDAMLTDIMLEEDKFGRSLYNNEQDLADKVRVSQIITVDLFDEYEGLLAIMVSLMDYTIGSNQGGELTSFEDFDIDYNQNKYLQETRLSGGLTKPFSAVVVTRDAGTAVATPLTAPSFNGTTNTITIPTETGVSYQIDDEEVSGDIVITETTEVDAHPETGYYIPANVTRSWTYTP